MERHTTPLLFLAALLLLTCFDDGVAADEPTVEKRRISVGSVLISTTLARSQLDAYDVLLAKYREDPTNLWQMAEELNELRGDILEYAINAYYNGGQIAFANDLDELEARLYANGPSIVDRKELPASLQELVTLNIIDHLPESPYPGALIVSEPEEVLPPGTILYKSPPTEYRYGLDYDGGREFYILAIIDTERNGYNTEVVEHYFRGDIYGLVDVIPKGIVFCEGFYPDKDSKYRKELGH